MSWRSLTEATLHILNTTGSCSYFDFQPAWAHSRGATIQHDCYQALNQVLGEDSPFEPLSGGPYSFSSGICSIGIYVERPSYSQRLRSPETWKNIKHWLSDTLLCIFAVEARPVGSVLNLNSGVQICIWEPTDTDPDSRCKTAIPYAANRALTLRQCLIQHEVQDLTRASSSTSYSNEGSQTQSQTSNSPSASHGSNQPIRHAQPGFSPSTPLRQDQHQAQGMMQSPPSAFQGITQYQAQAIPGDFLADSPALQPFRRPPAPAILKIRGGWTNQPLITMQCQGNLVTIRALFTQRQKVTQWALSGPIIHHSPPCSIGVYVTSPGPASSVTTITTSWGNVDDYLKMLIESEERNDLGAYIDLPSGIQVVLYNGAWLDPQNRLADTKQSSLQSELDSLAAIMRVNRFRNLTRADYDVNVGLVKDYFH